MTKTVLAAMVAASVSGFAAPSFAQTFSFHDQGFRNAPTRYDAPRGHRPGFVWVPGHYERQAHQSYWVEGRWMRDRDGDGVANRFDRFPNNPRRS